MLSTRCIIANLKRVGIYFARGETLDESAANHASVISEDTNMSDLNVNVNVATDNKLVTVTFKGKLKKEQWSDFVEELKALAHKYGISVNASEKP